eukprot:359525_1
MDAMELSVSSKVEQSSNLSNTYRHDFPPTDTEYDDYTDNGLSSDYDPSKPLQPLIPLKCTALCEFQMNNAQTDCEIALEAFFDTFLDESLDGEITICQFVSALKELCVSITEKEIYRMFTYIDHDQTGYIDAVDFVQFCTTSVFDNNEIWKLQDVLNSAIKTHPFMITKLTQNDRI